MRLEYSKGGSTCAYINFNLNFYRNYGNGVLCVMHVKQEKIATT